jgi:hypothetical protein
MKGPAGDRAKIPRGFERVPGVFRRAELEPVDKIEPGFHVEPAGVSIDGSEVVAVYRRGRTVARDALAEHAPVSVEVVLPDLPTKGERFMVRYCDVCSRWGRQRTLHICGINWFPKLETLLRDLLQERRAG